MASVILVASRKVSRAQGVTNYWCLGDSQGTEGSAQTEVKMQTTIRTAGTFSNMATIVSAFTLSGGATLTITSRKTNSNGNLSISPVGTGESADTTNSDLVSSGDLYCTQVACSAGAGAATVATLAHQFAANSGTVKRFAASGFAMTVASTTFFVPFAGSNVDTVEANSQLKSEIAGTLQNYQTHVILNNRSDATTVGSRLNGVNGSLTKSIPNTSTGVFEDTAHTDSVNVRDLICWYATLGSGTGSFLQNEVTGADFSTSGNQWYVGSCSSGTSAGQPLSPSSTYYHAIGGDYQTANTFTTESEVNITSRLAFTANNYGINVIANTGPVTVTVALRKSGSTTLLTVSSSGTGIVEDLTDSVAILATDQINHILTTGGSGTSVKVGGIWMVGTSSAISHFQTVGTQSTVAVSSKTVTPGSNILVGDLLVVRVTGTVAVGGAPTFTISDGTNSYASAIRVTNGVEATEEFWCWPALAVTSPIITATPSASATLSFAFSEYSVSTGYTVTIDGTATGTGSVGSTIWLTSTCTVTGTLDLVCSIIGCLGAPSSLTTTGYSDRYNAVAAGGDGIDCADLNTSSTATPSGTIGGAGLQNAEVAVSYKATPTVAFVGDDDGLNYVFVTMW